jgi:hypothetical protein
VLPTVNPSPSADAEILVGVTSTPVLIFGDIAACTGPTATPADPSSAFAIADAFDPTIVGLNLAPAWAPAFGTSAYALKIPLN